MTPLLCQRPQFPFLCWPTASPHLIKPLLTLTNEDDSLWDQRNVQEGVESDPMSCMWLQRYLSHPESIVQTLIVRTSIKFSEIFLEAQLGSVHLKSFWTVLTFHQDIKDSKSIYKIKLGKQSKI